MLSAKVLNLTDILSKILDNNLGLGVDVLVVGFNDEES